MNLFSAATGSLDPGAAELGQALADVATIGILNERAARRWEVVTEQLQAALNSGVLIEQAKGALAERLQLSVDEAFNELRNYARENNHKLRDIADAVIHGGLDIVAPAQAPRRPGPPDDQLAEPGTDRDAKRVPATPLRTA